MSDCLSVLGVCLAVGLAWLTGLNFSAEENKALGLINWPLPAQTDDWVVMDNQF